MQTVRITTPQNIDIDYEIAGLGERILARLIDYGIFIAILLLCIIIGSMAQLFNGEYSVGLLVMIIVYACLYGFYDLLCEIFLNGQSIGKRVLKIKVISLTGGQPTVGQYFLRWLFRMIDFTLTSDLCALVCVAVSDNNQRVGDIVAGTTLIKTNPRTHLNNVVFMPANDGYHPVFKEVIQLKDADVELVHEVINNYIKTGNSVVVYNMASRLKEHLSITSPAQMNDMQFLQTIVKDYNYLVAQIETL